MPDSSGSDILLFQRISILCELLLCYCIHYEVWDVCAVHILYARCDRLMKDYRVRALCDCYRLIAQSDIHFEKVYAVRDGQC